ncbi:EAL domain-containing protein (putative c-di-GMP-specific phosphodiesterase class I) [Novosphingobium sp. ST904]|nr:EAL domain-containing protein (putative c-di-GMP-specific phosphodiesterase class I) [Novosphingobium sp. ST904]
MWGLAMAINADRRRTEGTRAGAAHVARLARYPDTALFWFRIGNYPHLVAAYGQELASEAVATAHDHIARLVQDNGTMETCRADVLEVRIKRGTRLGDTMTPASGAAWAATVCEAIPLLAFASKAGPIHVWVSACWSIFTPESDSGESDSGEDASSPGDVSEWMFPFVGALPEYGEEAERYRADMAIVSHALTALKSMRDGTAGSGGLRPFWQKVRCADSGVTRYFEALARLSDSKGLPERPGTYILSMERLGFVRLLDLFMVRQVIAELERSEDIQIAVNLSALSLSDDPWWDDIRSTLRRNGHIARRLLLEITETASFPKVSDAVRFVDTMRRLGCGIVLDDFGTGYASVRQLLAFAPDIIKIDSLFLRRATASERGRAIFVSLAQLAKSISATVVAEGVETSQHRNIALEAGVNWQQGYLWGQPCGCRPRPYVADGLPQPPETSRGWQCAPEPSLRFVQ